MKSFKGIAEFQNKKRSRSFDDKSDADAWLENFKQTDHLGPVKIKVKEYSIENQLQKARKDALKKARGGR